MPGRAADLAVLPALEVLVRAPSIPEKILPAIVEGGWLSSATLLERLKDTQLLSYARVVLQLAIHHIEQALAAPWLLESLGFVLMALPHSLYGAIQAPLIEAQKLPKFTETFVSSFLSYLTKASELPNANVISRTLQAIAKPVTPGVLGPLCLASHYEYTLPIEARNPGQVWRQVAPADFNLDQLVEFLFSEQGLRHANKEVAYAASRSLASLCRADPFSVVPAILPFFQRALDPSPLSGLSAAELGVLSDPDGTLTAAGSFKFVVPEVDARNLNINTRGLARLRRAPDADDEPDRVEAPKPVPAAQPKAAAAAVKGQAGKGKGAEPAKGKAAGKDTPEQIAARAAAEEKLRKQDGLRAHVRVIVEQKRQALTAFESCVSASSDFFSKAMATLLPALLKLRWSYGVPNEAAHAIAIAVQHIEPRVRPLAGDITELLLHLREQNETLAPVLTSLFHELNEQATEHFQPGTFSLIFPLIAFALQNTDLLEVQQAAMILLEQHSEQPGALPRQQMTTVLVSLIGTQSRFQEAAETAMSQMHGNFKAVDLSDLMSCYLVEFPQQRRVVLEAGQSVLQRTLEVASPHIFYLATFDTENADLAKEICEEFQIVASPAYKDPFLALLAHPLFPMRNLAGKALSRLCATHPEISSSVVERTLASYRNNLPPKVDPKDPRSFQPEFLANLEQPHMLIARSGVAALIHHFGVQAKGTLASSAPGGLLRTLLRFLTNEGLGEAHTDIYRQMLEAGVELVKLNSSETSVILSILEDTLARTEKSKDPASLAVYDQIQGASVVLLGTLAAFLDPSSPSIDPIVTRLLQALHSNAESTQKAVSACFVPLMRQTLLGRAPDLLKQLVSEVLDTPSERDRRGAAHGLAGMIKGLGSSALDKYGVIGAINGALQNKRVAHARQGALWAIELFCMRLGRPFERFVPGLLPRLLSCFGDQVEAVRATAFDTSRAIMAILSPYGVQLVLPVIMKSLKDKNWRKQVGSIDLLASMSACAPKQLSFSLPAIVPKLCTCLMDTMAEISTAAKSALRRISVVITNHEIKRHIPVILQALNEPEQHTRSAIEALMTTNFVHTLDAPSLALIMPILQRGLKDRGTEGKRRSAFIVGNLSSLSDARDLEPYLPLVVPDLKSILLDPIPEARAVAARSLGSLVRGLGERKMSDLIPWLRKNMTSSQGVIERGGAAQGLSEVLTAVPVSRFEEILRSVNRDCSNSNPNAREGSLAFLSFLPASFQERLEPYLPEILPSLLTGLADSNETVRAVAIRGAQAFTTLYGSRHVELLLGSLEEGLFADSWRIRDGSINLIGMLLKILAPDPQKTDYGVLLGVERKNKIFAALYIAKSDVDMNVRNNAQAVWKDIVLNTPRTVRETIDAILSHIIHSLAVENDRRLTATKALGELADKYGDKVLDDIVGLAEHLNSPDPKVRLGATIGLSEVMSVIDRRAVLAYLDQLTKAVRTAVCDSDPKVRQAAGIAFDALARYTGNKTVMEVLSPLLVALEDPKQSKRAMEGLQQILSIKSDAVLPLLFPKLIVSPLTPFNAQALASIAKVVGPSIVKYLGIVLPVFLNSSYDETIRKCAEHFVIVIDAADELVSSLLPFLQTTPDIKTRASQLVAHYCTHTEADLTAQWHVIIQSLLKLFCDPVPAVREVAASSLKEIAERIPKEDLTNFISTVRDAMNMLKPNLIEGGIPGFDLPKALDPISAIFVAGLRAANPELRERAALGVAEMVELTTEKALAPYIIAVTGPIIRAMGDRVPVSVKVALLNTMMIIMEKSGARLKPFVPQLQTTFLKALQDPSVDIRYHASTALQKLLKQGPRIDPLITELVSSSQSAEVSIQEGLLRALKDTVVATGDKIGAAVISSAVAAMHSLLSSEDDRVRDRAAQVLSVLSPYVPLETILSGLLEEGSTVFEHGSVLVLRHLAPRVSLDPYLDAISAKLDRNLATEVPLLKVATLETVAALLSQKDSALQTLVAGRFLDSIGAEVNTGSIEIALACLRCLKTFGKTSPSQCEAKLASSWVSPIVNRVKDHSNAVLKVAAERALYYVFNCRSGSAVVQRYAAALPNKEDAKYLADLYKRVLSKFSPDSDNEEEE